MLDMYPPSSQTLKSAVRPSCSNQTLTKYLEKYIKTLISRLLKASLVVNFFVLHIKDLIRDPKGQLNSE